MDIKFLKECIRVEVIGRDHEFSWRKALTRTRNNRRKRFMFWWRVASFLYRKGGVRKKIAKRIEVKLQNDFDIEIPLTVNIGAGLELTHLSGIIITRFCVIGERLTIKQGVTIGLRTKPDDSKIIIGNDVDIGCNSSILGGKITIGDNAIIGAHSLVTKSVPASSIYKNTVQPVITKLN